MNPKITVFLPHLETGGIEKGLVTLAPLLLDDGLRLRFVLQRRVGALLADLDSRVVVHDLGGGGMVASARALARIMRDDPADVLYTATNATNIAGRIASRILGRRSPAHVISEHIPIRAFLATRKRPWMRKALMRALYPGAARFVAPAQPLIDEHRALIGRSCPDAEVMPNPVVQSVNTARTLSPRVRRIVCVGRLSPEKDFALALEAFALFCGTADDLSLTIYGEGAERGRLQSQIERLGLAGRARLAGRTADIDTVLESADLFLCTSRVEGFGNALVEAQAAGVPIVSVDCPVGPRIILDDGKAGRLIESRAPQVLANALTSFCGDIDARRSAQQHGFGQAQGYTVARSAQAHARLFRDLAKR